MTTTTTRRAILAGTAAVIPAAALAAIPARSGPDPVYEAIELHRASFKAYGDLLAREEEPSLCDASAYEAWREECYDASCEECLLMAALVSTEPRTVAGAVALLNYCLSGDDLGIWLDGEGHSVDLTERLLRTLAAALPKIAA